MKYNGKTYKSQQIGVNKYNERNYKQLNFRVKLGNDVALKEFAAENGLSVNALIIDAINEYAEKRTGQPILDLFDKSIIPPKTEKAE